MNTVQPSNIENRIQVTVYLYPLLYVDSEVFDSALTDVNQTIFINPPLPGLGEELENPIKDEWERFIKDCVFVTKEAGFTIINNEYDSESNKSEAVITYGVGTKPSGTIICNLRISEQPFDAAFPEEYKAKVQEYLKESSILDGTARKAGIDFQVEKVIVNDIETDSWLNGFNKLYSLMRMKMTDNNMTNGYPYSIEAEQAVLGAIISNGKVIYKVAEILTKSEHFYVKIHRHVFDAMIDLYCSGKSIDFVTLLEQLKKNKVFDESKGKAYLKDLAENCPNISNAAEYAKIIREKYELRTFINALQKAICEAADGTTNLTDIINEVDRKIYDIMRDTTNALEPFSKGMLRVFDRLDINVRNSDKSIPTGFKGLDKIITGLNRSDLILLAARPGMGKTSFALDIAKHAAVNQKKTVAFFSLEMSTDQIVTRLLSSEAMVERTKMLTGDISDEEWFRIVKAGDALAKCDLYLDSTPYLTVGEMKSKLYRFKNIDFVVVDYLQLMSSRRKNSNYVREVSEIIKSLKELAKELNIPVLCVSQLSRSPEERDDHRPIISDFSNMYPALQDVDTVLLLYREGYYAKRNDTKIDHKSCECIVAKNSHGETTGVMLEWQGEFMRFKSME